MRISTGSHLNCSFPWPYDLPSGYPKLAEIENIFQISADSYVSIVDSLNYFSYLFSKTGVFLVDFSSVPGLTHSILGRILS